MLRYPTFCHSMLSAMFDSTVSKSCSCSAYRNVSTMRALAVVSTAGVLAVMALSVVAERCGRVTACV
jgi:hypothetical protein